ncbi:MAG: sugar ABC transporter permease [Clostridiales bacterium]|nr:sugar ABC transporter permease [Clostridiales bacterium]
MQTSRTARPAPGLIEQKWRTIKKDWIFYLLLLFGMAYFVLFHYVPMYGAQIAFRNFRFKDGITGSQWVGMRNFVKLFAHPDLPVAFRNTIVISLMKIAFGFPMPVLLALSINSVWSTRLRRAIQSISYLPYFLSWVVVGGILTTMLSPGTGVVNRVIQALGGEPIYFMASVPYFRGVLVVSDIWKEIGWSSIIYLAALSGVDGQLYEAATVDGANKFRQLLAITLPSIAPTIITLFILRVGNILNAGMDQIYAMYSPPVYSVSDILDTLSLRIGIKNMQYSMSTATSIFKSIIGLAMILISNRLCKFIDEDSGIF